MRVIEEVQMYSVCLLPLLLTLLTLPSFSTQDEALPLIQLPEPQTEGGAPLLRALKERKSTRAFSSRMLPDQLLSNLLWAAWGINRPDGRRTAPSANNRQEIELFVILPSEAFLYEAQSHTLKRVAEGDFRSQGGTQDYVKSAPVNLVYVADISKMRGEESTRILYYGVSAGAIVQNVYLFCASEGLACVVRASIDREALARSLSLEPEERITVAQSVGFPVGQ